ncbi:MFS transporter [Arthrobacter sp. NPDC058288]|uniref:MFS transporter n=1 Tax=Arthrobacter sp. NPDC058288 TaxID=3346424 RepID=UPI0036EAFF7E
MKRLLIPSSALLWGLQFAFLSPALALLLVALYNATAAEVGWVLAVSNASAFVASWLVPAYADRKQNYLAPMLGCGILTLALAGLLAATTSLPVAVVGLIVLGGPAGVGSSLLFAHLRHSGASITDSMNTRAIVSFAWVAGPPLATFIMGTLGNRAILLAIGAVAVLNIGTTAAMISRRQRRLEERGASAGGDGDSHPMSTAAIAAVFVGFIALHAANRSAVSIMSLFVTQKLGLDVMWAGVILGVSAAAEIPALLLIGRLGRRFSSRALLTSGCVTGIAYYAAMAFATSPAVLVALQVLNAWSFAMVAGVGLTLFQQIIPRPGLASGLFTNAARLGAVVSGAVIGLGSTTALGYQGVFAASAALTVLAMVILSVAGRTTGRRREPGGAEQPQPAGAAR